VRLGLLAALLLLLLASSAHAEEPAFEEGDVLGFADVAKLEPFLPPEFWAHRDLFFYEGMQLEIGPTQRDYSPAAEYVAATEQFAGKAKLGPDGSLEGYVAGQPFPMEQIDCAGDPDAGTKIAWNFAHRWEGAGTQAHFRLAYLDRGEELPLFIEGSIGAEQLAHRVEGRYAGRNADRFPNEKRERSFGVEVTAPESARGVALLSYRYKDGRSDAHWLYLPARRTTMRWGIALRSVAIAGTDFTLDDWGGFDGADADHEWRCQGATRVIAPMNTQRAAFPYALRSDFGPTGASYASDRWEVRHAVRIRLVPKDGNRPYSRKDLWVDAQTLAPLYSFAYDRMDALWKIIWHNHRWSGDSLPEDAAPWYPGWDGVPEPRDLRVVSDAIANVSTGSVTRIDFWDARGTPPRRAHGHQIDLDRLTRQRN
jgi:hypothetical protein